MKSHEPPPVQCLATLTPEQRLTAPGVVKREFSFLLEETLIVHFWKEIRESAFSTLLGI